MLRVHAFSIFVVTLLLARSACAQPKLPFPPTGEISRGLKGLEDAIRSSSQTNMRPSMAGVDREQARSMSYDNQAKKTQTYFENRRANRAYRDAERTPRASRADLERYARDATPDRLTSRQYDPYYGRINWPVIVKGARYASDRQRLDRLFASHAAAGGGINTVEYGEIQSVGASMESSLKEDIANVTPEQYTYTRKFLKSLRAEARYPVGS